MERTEFEKLLSGGGIPSVLLFEGEEEHLKQKALGRLRQLILPAGMEDLNETVLENPESDAVIAASETLPFMADRRLVVVRDLPALSGRAEGDDRLAEYLPSVPPSTVLLFFCEGKPDGRKKIYGVIRRLGGIVTFSSLKGAELTGFVTDAFRAEGKECDRAVADYLVFTVGPDTNLLLSEIAKIASFSGARTTVTAADVSALATPSTECTVFQMVDAVVSGQKSRAFSLLRNQLGAGTDRMAILSLLLRQYRFLQHIKIMQYEKKSVDFIRNALGVPPFAVNQYLRQASAYTGGQVKKAVTVCFDTEYAVKSGRLLPDSALDTVILKLLTLRQKE